MDNFKASCYSRRVAKSAVVEFLTDKARESRMLRRVSAVKRQGQTAEQTILCCSTRLIDGNPSPIRRLRIDISFRAAKGLY